MTTTFVLRGLDTNGGEFFYTGRAGQRWVSPNIDEAFTYTSLEGARNAALRHNRWTELHGLRFIALDRNHDGGDWA